ncbi:hypothetical protein yc1106_04147 [Curvularia clavata]|uniref:Heterokaryon incompatibility domain-containing protein n=1 Tax=Curvularia clavata TaxID=95742 RepID=A0A9Q8Z9S6_CURCL|nr:hypothetical protein yc1106_04147 [Curvularia clavata]
MRLINTNTLELTYFVGDAPEYAILSHRWEDEEILFEDVSKIPLSSPENPARSKFGFAKFIGTCALAANDGYEWVWIDSCCIDKSSSAELQESINSMFRWYRQAQVCYAYLSDVADESSGWSEDFEKSQWFARGWTLQELLAPSNVEFYSADWSPIGTKLCRTGLIASITSIETDALEFDWGTTEDSFCAAQKFSWAAHRRVSKVEDSAYCLFGLFNVNMPLLYGEGEEKAFHRLQQAIFEETADYSLFLFARAPSASNVSMLASQITRFCRRPHCSVCRSHEECLHSDIPYSDVVRNAVPGQFSTDAHYIRLVRQGAIIKLPLMEHIAPEERNLGIEGCTLLGKFAAILPLSLRRIDKYVFGIVLGQVSASGYIRMLTIPVLLNMNTLKIDGNRQGAYTVYNEFREVAPIHYIGSALSSVASAVKIAHFEFLSRSFKPFDWRCDNQHPNLVQTTVKASFPLPEQLNDRFYLTVSLQNLVDQNMIGAVRLWYSMSEIGLHGVGFYRDQRCLGQWEVKHTCQSRRYMSIIIPLGEDGHSLKVVLRRISIPEHEWHRVIREDILAFLTGSLETPRMFRRPYQIQAGYRLCITQLPKRCQASIRESVPH